MAVLGGLLMVLVTLSVQLGIVKLVLLETVEQGCNMQRRLSVKETVCKEVFEICVTEK